MTPESLIGGCVAQHLERLEQIDAVILEIAQVVGELGSNANAFGSGSLCRYQPAKPENLPVIALL